MKYLIPTKTHCLLVVLIWFTFGAINKIDDWIGDKIIETQCDFKKIIDNTSKEVDSEVDNASSEKEASYVKMGILLMFSYYGTRLIGIYLLACVILMIMKKKSERIASPYGETADANSP